MQVLASSPAKAGRPSQAAILTALLVGTLAIAVSAALMYLVFGEDLMSRFMPKGRASTYELVIGALAWTFALTAPAGPASRRRFGFAGRSGTTTRSPPRSASRTGTGSCRSSSSGRSAPR